MPENSAGLKVLFAGAVGFLSAATHRCLHCAPGGQIRGNFCHCHWAGNH